MKQNYFFRRTFSALVLLFASTLSWAYDLEEGDYFQEGVFWYVLSSNTSVFVRNCAVDYPKSLIIPSQVTHKGKTYYVTAIGDRACSFRCSTLTSISIPGTVKSIGDYAFHGCESLTSIYIPTSVTSIGHRAFSGCTSLSSIDFPYSEISIGDYAFYGCTSLASIYFPTNVASIGERAFYGCTSLVSVNLPGSVGRIKACAFQGCTSLTTALIGNGVTDIDEAAFQGCSSLTTLDLPLTLTSIRRSAFANCSSLTSVYIPYNVTSIESEAFWYCESLTSIVIGDGVTSIGYSVFHGCSSLTTVVCRAKSVPPVDTYVFYYSPISKATLYVPASAIEAYKQAHRWESFGTILPIEGNEDIIDAIDSPVARPDDGNDSAAPYYTLDGKPVGTPVRKGIYIKGGRKVLY